MSSRRPAETPLPPPRTRRGDGAGAEATGGTPYHRPATGADTPARSGGRRKPRGSGARSRTGRWCHGGERRAPGHDSLRTAGPGHGPPVLLTPAKSRCGQAPRGPSPPPPACRRGRPPASRPSGDSPVAPMPRATRLPTSPKSSGTTRRAMPSGTSSAPRPPSVVRRPPGRHPSMTGSRAPLLALAPRPEPAAPRHRRNAGRRAPGEECAALLVQGIAAAPRNAYGEPVIA